MEETRVVNETTGGAKGAKDVKMSLIPVDELWEVCKLYNFGAQKYAPNNWRKGYDWSLSYDALNRHLHQFWNGDSTDEETQCHHLASVVFHAFALMHFEKNYPELDDRPKTTLQRDREERNAERLMRLFQTGTVSSGPVQSEVRSTDGA